MFLFFLVLSFSLFFFLILFFLTGNWLISLFLFIWPMYQLPDELLFQVFDALPAAELLELRLLSRKMCRVASDVYFRKTQVTISDPFKLDDLLNHLIPGPCVASLPIRHLELQPNAWMMPSDLSSGWMDRELAAMVGRIKQLLQHVRTLSVVFPAEMYYTTPQSVKWGLLLPVLRRLPLLRHFRLVLPNYTFFPGPAVLSPHLTHLYLACDLNLGEIVVFAQQLQQLVVFHVQMDMEPYLGEQPLERLIADKHMNIHLAQSRHLRELSYAVQEEGRPDNLSLARLLHFFFYMAPCLDKLIIKHPYGEKYTLTRAADLNTPPFDASLPFWENIGIPRLIYFVEGNFSPYLPCHPQQHEDTPTTGDPESGLFEIKIKHAHCSAMFMLMADYLPAHRVTSLVLDYYSADVDEEVVDDELLEDFWPHLLDTLPMLPMLTSLLIRSVRRLRMHHVANIQGNTQQHVRLEQLTLVNCSIDEPSTLENLLQTRLEPRQFTLQNSLCYRGHLGETAIAHPLAPLLASMHAACRFDYFRWWTLPLVNSRLHLHLQDYPDALIIVLQDPAWARTEPFTRMWVTRNLYTTNNVRPIGSELTQEEVQRVISHLYEFADELHDPHLEIFDSYPRFTTFFDHAIFCLTYNYISVYCCQSLDECVVNVEPLAHVADKEIYDWPLQ
ncbi:hypothetical protein BC940DRAFT_296540 [Gongronella butleri]|nr:hypothetical protein BC940DRAFT_296540 [Gongronella butleri]